VVLLHLLHMQVSISSLPSSGPLFCLCRLHYVSGVELEQEGLLCIADYLFHK